METKVADSGNQSILPQKNDEPSSGLKPKKKTKKQVPYPNWNSLSGPEIFSALYETSSTNAKWKRSLPVHFGIAYNRVISNLKVQHFWPDHLPNTWGLVNKENLPMLQSHYKNVSGTQLDALRNRLTTFMVPKVKQVGDLTTKVFLLEQHPITKSWTSSLEEESKQKSRIECASNCFRDIKEIQEADAEVFGSDAHCELIVKLAAAKEGIIDG
jgi:hypothetical protein